MTTGFTDFLRMLMGWWASHYDPGDRLCGTITTQPALGATLSWSSALGGGVDAQHALSGTLDWHNALSGDMDGRPALGATLGTDQC